MKRYSFLLIVLSWYYLGYATIFDSNAFRISQDSTISILKNQNYSITADTSIFLDIHNQISCLMISGKTILKDQESIVRILLKDTEGHEFLVFEDYYLFSGEKEHTFSNTAMETAILENIVPDRLCIIVRNAEIEISQISGIYTNQKQSLLTLQEKRKNVLASQEEYFIESWNKYNAQNNQYWVAGKTAISSLSYSEKKRILGANSDSYLSDGIEYYIGGFFVLRSHNIDSTTNEIQESSQRLREINTTYVDSFDWRNRHGKNWMTSVKHQEIPFNNVSGNGGCWAFGSLAALESHVNLYYNRLLDLDLSEQELGSCTSGSLQTGGTAVTAYKYIKNNGIVNEECFLFQNDENIPCDDKCNTPQYVVNISDYTSMTSSTNLLKSELINHGPIASGINTGTYGIRHLMCLCGYGVVEAGNIAKYVPQATAWIDTIIPANSPLVGQTYWIYKDSYGENSNLNGYVYVIYESDNNRAYTTALSYPVSVSTLTTNDIICEDADNDGYYFWGLGPKPNNCPVCCPDVPDGDDSNSQLAEMDSYGNFSTYNFPYTTTTISSNTTWNSDTIHCGHIIVTNNATLTITAQLTMNPAAKITVQNGGRLVVDTGSIVNATIDVQESAKFHLLHNGTIYLKQFGNLNVELGAEVDIEYGCVLLQ